jgi:hypothetical protein
MARWRASAAGVTALVAPSPTDGVDFLTPRVGYGFGLDMVSARQGWIWLYRFGDAVGRPEALARSTGLLKTSDGGRTWSQFRIPGYDIVPPFNGTGWPVQLGPVGVQFLPGDPDVGWALTSATGAAGGYFGDGTILWYTADGGKDWTASGA